MGTRLSQGFPRVYVLTPSFPPTLGGQENHLLELSQSLIDAGAGLCVITRRGSPEFPARERLGLVPVERLHPMGAIKGVGLVAAPRLGSLLLRMMWRLWRDASDYDVVLVSGFNFMPLAPVLAGLITGKPCVVRPESPLEVTEAIGADSRRKMHLSENAWPLRWLARLRTAAARKVDRYIAISSEIRAGLAKVGVDPARVVDVPNGIAVERFAPVSAPDKALLRERLGLPRDPLLMIYTGRLATTKGVMMLIAAWSELAPTFAAAHLIIVGAGHGSFDDCEAPLRAFIAANDLQSRVTLTGMVPNVHEYLQASDVFVFPSDYEGFSLSILEAMTVGLPLVCTRVGIAAELERTHRFGLLVPPKDPTAFRDALRTLLTDPALRAELGANARTAVVGDYSLAAEAARYLQVFADLGVRRGA